jgi:hypothetical protein
MRIHTGRWLLLAHASLAFCSTEVGAQQELALPEVKVIAPAKPRPRPVRPRPPASAARPAAAAPTEAPLQGAGPIVAEDIRNSVSYTKDEVLMPGASVRAFANVKY